MPTLLPIEPDVTPLDFATEQQAGARLADEREATCSTSSGGAWDAWHPSVAAACRRRCTGRFASTGHYADARQVLQIAVDAAHILGDLELEGGSRHDLGQHLARHGRAGKGQGRVRPRGRSGPTRRWRPWHRDVDLQPGRNRGPGAEVRRGRPAALTGHSTAPSPRISSRRSSTILLRLGHAYRPHSRTRLIRIIGRHRRWPSRCTIPTYSSKPSFHSPRCRPKSVITPPHKRTERGRWSWPSPVTTLKKPRRLSWPWPESTRPTPATATRSTTPARPSASRSARNVQVEAEALDALATSLVASKRPDGAREGWEQARVIYLDRGDHDRVAHIAVNSRNAGILGLTFQPPARIPLTTLPLSDRSVVED